MPGALRAHIDHRPAVLPHPHPPGALHQPQRRLDVHGERRPPRIRIGVHERAVRLVRRRVVDDHVDSAEGVQRQLGELAQVFRVGDIPGEADTAQLLGRARHFVNVPRAHAHQRPGPGERLGDRAPDPARAAGDQSGPAP
jgi:hypothetical protein